MTNSLDAFISKMKKAGLSTSVIDTFIYYYKQVVEGETGLLSDKDIGPVSPEDVIEASDLQSYADHGHAVMSKTVSIVLNGGLGTSMGLTKAKSLLLAKNNKSFLELKLKQAESHGAQIAFMNSFHTHSDTIEAVSKIDSHLKPMYFLQNKFPKILKADLTPAHWPEHSEMEWNPPGHGDIYAALHTSGLLKRCLETGIKYAFIANSDNLGATLDAELLGFFASEKLPFMMEVAERTPTDLKGGHLARHKSGHLVLREIAQCPKNEISAFQDLGRYRYFNTNNIWVHLELLYKVITEKGGGFLPIIVNPKTLDPRDATSPQVYQIETAMGAAIAVFHGAKAVKVSENRFFPVKKCQDLLAIRSDCYRLAEDGRLESNPKRKLGPIKIKLDDSYYGYIDALERRFKWIPSLVACESLNIHGNIFFEKNVNIIGRVKITNPHDKPLTIKSATITDQDLVF